MARGLERAPVALLWALPRPVAPAEDIVAVKTDVAHANAGEEPAVEREGQDAAAAVFGHYSFWCSFLLRARGRLGTAPGMR